MQSSISAAVMCSAVIPKSVLRSPFLAPRLPMQVTPRTHSVSGDTALVMFDWVIDGTAPDGQKVLLQGSAVDVLRRGQDGYWRQFFDCPFGSATEPS